MTAERQIDRIRKAEEAMRELAKVADQLRQEIDKLPVSDVDPRSELLRSAEALEGQVRYLRDSLRNWREDIN